MIRLTLVKDYLCAISYAEDSKGIYVLDVIYTQAGMEVTEILTAKQLYDHSVTHAYIESNNGGRGFARQVEAKNKELGNYKTRIEWLPKRLISWPESIPMRLQSII